jgi:hypothetical protein
MSLDTLPVEIITTILSFCQPTDILKSKLVSRRFNDIIKNSPKIIARLTFFFPNDTYQQKYQKHLKDFPHGDDIPKCSKMVLRSGVEGATLIPSDYFHDRLTHLKVRNVGVVDIMVEKMLVRSPNLRILEMSEVHFVRDGTKVQTFPEHKNLTVIMRDSSLGILDIIKNCEVKSLALASYELLDVGKLKIFLKNQRKLTELSLIDISCNIFQHNKFDTVNFQLQKLRLENVFIPRDPHFENFLSNHSDSLRTLEVFDCKIVGFGDVLRKLRRVEEISLKVDDKMMKTIPKLDGVKKITIKRTKIPQIWLQKFPNAKKIKN